MNVKHIITTSLSAFIIAGCQVTPIEDLYPTATQETIDTALEHLSDIEGMSVTENGVIYYVHNLPGDSRWSTVHIMELSYRNSCEHLRWFVDRGMIVRSTYRGNSGTTQDYDLARCETETPTDLFK